MSENSYDDSMNRSDFTKTDPTYLSCRHNRADGVLDALFSGCDLAIFLEPSAEIRGRRGTEPYIETLELPHIIGYGEHFWGCQTADAIQMVNGRPCRTFFSYCSGLDLFANNVYQDEGATFRRQPQTSQIMSSGRYRTLEWHTRSGFQTVFTSDRPEEKEAYVEAIRANARFKILIEQEDGSFQIHPLFYPFYYTDSDRIEYQTPLQFFPDFMRVRLDVFVRDYLQGRLSLIDDPFDTEKREKQVTIGTPFFPSFFHGYGDAHLKRLYDIDTDRTIQAARITIFAA